MIRHQIVATLSVLAALSTAALAETLESVEKVLAEKMAAHKTLRFKQKTTSDMNTGDMRIQVQAESVVTHARKPENGWASRVEAKTRTVRSMKDQPEEKQDAKMLSIADGKHMHVLTETPEITSAIRQKLDGPTAMNPFDVKALFAIQRKEFDLKVLPDEKVEGADCYVIQSSPKEGSSTAQMSAFFARAVNYYDKKTGVGIKGLVYDKDGKVTTTTLTTDVKFDEPVADDQFVFKAPPGVQVVDMSEMQQGSGSGQAATGETNAPQAKPAPSTEASPAAQEPAKSAESKDSGEKKKDSGGKAVKSLLKGLGR